MRRGICRKRSPALRVQLRNALILSKLLWWTKRAPIGPQPSPRRASSADPVQRDGADRLPSGSRFPVAVKNLPQASLQLWDRYLEGEISQHGLRIVTGRWKRNGTGC